MRRTGKSDSLSDVAGRWVGVGLWFALSLLLGNASAQSARATPPAAIDTGAACLGSCHGDFARKATVHNPARSGKACVRCHEPKAPNQHAFKPLPAKMGPVCLNCHDELAEARKVRHSPFRSGSCTRCHDPHQSDHPSLLRQPPPALCVGCHDDLNLDQKVVHGPVGQGKCLECHDPHGTDHPALLGQPAPELCFNCHAAAVKNAQGRALPAIKKQFDDKKLLLHAPFAQGRCTECHRPHASPTRALLANSYPDAFYAGYGADAYALCFGCHDQAAFEQPRTVVDSDFRNGNLNLHFRHVNRDKGRSCGACHAPHGSYQPKLVTQEMRFGAKLLALNFEKTATGGSCTTACHGPVTYDRCQPVAIGMKTTPRQGREAGADELLASCAKKEPAAAPAGAPDKGGKEKEKDGAKAK